MQHRLGRRQTPLVLCVDDDATARLLIRMAMAATGFDVVEADSGREAIEAFRSRQPDLILMDFHMGDLDGLEACRAIRSLPDGKDVPVVILTGDEDRDTVRRAYDAGATDFERKDVPAEILSERVKFLMRAKTARDDLHDSERRLENAQRLARVGDWEWELASDRHTWSLMMFELLGREPSTHPVHRDFLAAVRDEDRDRIERALRDIARDGGAALSEFRVCHPGGQELILQLRAEPVRDADGETIGLAGTLQDITEIRRAEHQIRQLAYFDPVTGLPNRRLFFDRLDAAIAQAARRRSHVALIFIDLDNFKIVNDTMGHAAGDALLKSVAQRLRAATRTSDAVVRLESEAVRDGSIGRLGGDEFVVLLTDVTQDLDVGVVAGRIVRALKEPYHINGKELLVTASAGISMYPRDARDAEALLKHADAAMYAAKDAGRDGFCFFDTALNEAATRRVTLESRLRRALDEFELRLHYQPIVSATTGMVTGGECLIRWEHPDDGLILPGRFIPIAEESGLIGSLGEWVIRTACVQQEEWRKTGLVVPLSVNVSGRELQTQDFARSLAAIVTEVLTDPSRLTVEITEGVLLRESDIVMGNLNTLCNLGVRIAIDDFGTGYSSLNYLRRFPVHQIKVDRSFIRDLETDTGAIAIAETISVLSRRLGIDSVAEGVENKRQRDILTGLGFAKMQGFLFGRPLPPAEFIDLVLRLNGRATAAGT